jgi:hypothetical protein
LLAFRILGARHVNLPLNTPQYWALRARVPQYFHEVGTERTGAWKLDRYRVPSMNGIIDLYCEPLTVLELLLEQYAYGRGPLEIRARPGNVVIDSGG